MIDNFDTLESVIQINGGKTIPDHLDSRELFVDADGYLYVGQMDSEGNDITTNNGSSSAIPVKCKEAAKLVCTEDLQSLIINLPNLTYHHYSKSGPTKGILWMSNGTEVNSTMEGDPSVDWSTLNGFKLRNCFLDLTTPEGMEHSITGSIRLNDLHCTSISDIERMYIRTSMYGTQPPSEAIKNPSQGQIYFQLV